MNLIDLHGFMADFKAHAAEHRFHVHDERHFVETYSNRQLWETDLHPEDACGGPLDLVVTLEAEARTLILFEDALAEAGLDGVPDDDITLPMTFGFVLPPLAADCPDLLVLATNLAGIGGTELPLQVSSLSSSAAVSDRPESTVSIVGRVDLPMVRIYDHHDLTGNLLDRAYDICEFLLDRAPAWLSES